MKHNYDPEVEGQYRALVSGSPIRRRWHLNKLWLFELSSVSEDDLVLDAGCGAGNLVFEIAPHCRSVIGCDYHHGRLTFAVRRGRGIYAEATLERLPFADKVFDKIFCLEVLEHMELRITSQVLQEFHRVLKPDGQLLVTTPNYRSLWPLIEVFVDILRLVPKVPGGDHISKYHWRTFEGALTAAGFAISRIGTFNHLSPFMALLCEGWAERLYRWELQESRAGGNLLYALCEKP